MLLKGQLSLHRMRWHRNSSYSVPGCISNGFFGKTWHGFTILQTTGCLGHTVFLIHPKSCLIRFCLMSLEWEWVVLCLKGISKTRRRRVCWGEFLWATEVLTSKHPQGSTSAFSRTEVSPKDHPRRYMIQRTDKAFRSPLEASRRSKNCLRLGNIWDRKDLEKIQETLEDIPNQGLGNDGLQTKPSPLPICTECYRNTAMPVCLCIIYGCLCTMVAELSSSPKPKILIICPTEKICHIVFKLGSKEQ